MGEKNTIRPEILPEISDLLEEIGAKNHVMVVKYGSKTVGKITRPVFEGSVSGTSTALAPALVLADKARVMKGLKPVYLDEVIRRMGGELRSVTPNLRTNVGIDFVYTQLGSASPTTQADYIALSNNTTAPSATHTGGPSGTVPWSSAQAADAAASGTTGEYTVLGVARKQATPAHTGSATSYTMSATWTATGTVTSLQVAGLFGGSTRTTQSGATATNILFLENTFTATSLVNNDQLSLTWTVNI